MAGNYNFVMDPDGDVLLTLNNANAPFAVWPCPLVPSQYPKPEDGTPAQGMTFLLSSRHLSLASPVLKTALSGKWTEGTKTDGLHHVSAEDWDSDALATVMNIVHGRWSSVPREVSFENLAKIAVIVDYYDIREPLQLILSHWMNKYDASFIPTVLDRNLVLWILVSWVFKIDHLFQKAAKVAIVRSTDGFKIPRDVPIPSSVIGKKILVVFALAPSQYLERKKTDFAFVYCRRD